MGRCVDSHAPACAPSCRSRAGVSALAWPEEAAISLAHTRRQVPRGHRHRPAHRGRLGAGHRGAANLRLRRSPDRIHLQLRPILLAQLVSLVHNLGLVCWPKLETPQLAKAVPVAELARMERGPIEIQQHLAGPPPPLSPPCIAEGGASKK